MSHLATIIALTGYWFATIQSQVLYIDTPATWTAAQAYCSSQGSNLLTATSENTGNINECISSSSGGGVWIGLSRSSSSSQWSWASDDSYSENATPWRTNFPKSSWRSSDCAVLITSGRNSIVGTIANTGDADCSSQKTYCCDPSGGSSPSSPSATPAPVTPSPVRSPITSSCSRDRKEWNTATTAERNLYINGILELSKLGRLQVFTQTHGDKAGGGQAHGGSGFLPWHRLFLFELESAIRGLGGEYECFSLLYWNIGKDADDYNGNYDSYSVLNSGLGSRGDSSNNYCVTDGPFRVGEYEPYYCPNSYRSNDGRCCLRRGTYSNSISTSIYYSIESEDVITDSEIYSTLNGIRDNIENGPHGNAHCALGGCGTGHLGNFYYSPDDPLFYLLHGYIDFLWALWQDYNEHDKVDKDEITLAQYRGSDESDIDEEIDMGELVGQSWNDLKGTETIRDVINTADMGYRYEYGSFIDDVDFPKSNLDETHFFEDPVRRRRRRMLKENDGKIFERSAYQQLVNKYGEDVVETKQGRRKLVKTLAKMSCEFRNTGGYECERPAYFDDCSDMERGYNMDINITLDQLIEKVADYPCMVETRKLMYPWLVQQGGLWRLCRGDFDRFCDKSFIKNRPKKNQCEARGYIKERKRNKRSESVMYGYNDGNESSQQYEYQSQQTENTNFYDRDWMDIMINAGMNGIVIIFILYAMCFIWMCYRQFIQNKSSKGYNKVQKYIDHEDI